MHSRTSSRHPKMFRHHLSWRHNWSKESKIVSSWPFLQNQKKKCTVQLSNARIEAIQVACFCFGRHDLMMICKWKGKPIYRSRVPTCDRGLSFGSLLRLSISGCFQDACWTRKRDHVFWSVLWWFPGNQFSGNEFLLRGAIGFCNHFEYVRMRDTFYHHHL